jgi:hypothetical protein
MGDDKEEGEEEEGESEDKEEPEEEEEEDEEEEELEDPKEKLEEGEFLCFLRRTNCKEYSSCRGQEYFELRRHLAFSACTISVGKLESRAVLMGYRMQGVTSLQACQAPFRRVCRARYWCGPRKTSRQEASRRGLR